MHSEEGRQNATILRSRRGAGDEDSRSDLRADFLSVCLGQTDQGVVAREKNRSLSEPTIRDLEPHRILRENSR